MKIIRKTMKKIKKVVMDPRVQYFKQLLEENDFKEVGQKQMNLFSDSNLVKLFSNGKKMIKEVRIPREERRENKMEDLYSYFVYSNNKLIAHIYPSIHSNVRGVIDEFNKVMAM